MKKTNERIKIGGYIHTKKRLKERYGVDMNRSEYKEMCRYLRKKAQKKRLAFGENRTYIIRYVFKNNEFPVAYDTKTNTVRTAFPRTKLSRIFFAKRQKKKELLRIRRKETRLLLRNELLDEEQMWLTKKYEDLDKYPMT